MERGKLGTLVDCLSVVVDKIPARPEYSASRYTNRDAVNSAFGAFFFQFPSLLKVLRELQEREKRDNAQSLFDVKGIPGGNQTRNTADGIEPGAVNPVFNQALKAARQSGVINEYRVLDGGVLPAIDGARHFSSENVHCSHCLTNQVKDKGGDERTAYYHAAAAGAAVKPGRTKVLPAAPEIIRNTGGEKKQDCELAAGKRRLEAHADEYAWLNPALLGDDLYSNRPFCGSIVKQGWSFIFTRKEEPHQWLMETVRDGDSHAADIFFLLNLLPLQFHTILEYCGLEYQLAFSTFSVRVAFFEALRVLIRRRHFSSRPEFLQYVRGKDDSPL